MDLVLGAVGVFRMVSVQAGKILEVTKIFVLLLYGEIVKPLKAAREVAQPRIE